MKGAELFGQVRQAVYVEGMSGRETARRFGIDPRTVAKRSAFSVPPAIPAEQASGTIEAGSVHRDD